MRYTVSQIQDYPGADTWSWEMAAVEADGGAEMVARCRDRKDLPSVPEARRILAERKARYEAMEVRPPHQPAATEEGYW
jgi:hypothetical protein